MNSRESLLVTEVGGLLLKNPVILGASGLTKAFTGVRNQIERGYGAIVTKTVTESPRKGAPKPSVFWYDPEEKNLLSGAEALENPGCEKMARVISQVQDLARHEDCKIIASVSEQSPEKMASVAKQLEQSGADAIEMNFACPSVGGHLGETYERLGHYWSQSPERSVEALCAVKEAVAIPVWAKVRVGNLVKSGFLAEVERQAEPDALSFRGGAMPCLVIDVRTGKPKLPGNVQLKWKQGIPTFPSVAGPIKTSTILYTAYLAKCTKTPIISLGGLRKGSDVIEALMVGAAAVGICSIVYREKYSCRRILEELDKFLKDHGYSSVEELRGVALEYLPAPPVLSVPGV